MGPHKQRAKYKKMREITQVYKGDNEHDNAPPTVEWEEEFAQEKKKLELREKRLAERLQAQKAFQTRRRQEAQENSSSISDLKIQPNESLRNFTDRVNTTARLAASKDVNAAKNRAQKAKLTAKREKRQAERERYVSDDEDDDNDKRGGKSHKRALPRFLDVADRPPEFSITENKKRFREAPSGGDSSREMHALSSRVQSLYKKKKAR